MISKREALEKLREHFLAWLSDQKFPGKEELLPVCRETSIDKIVAVTETYLLAPYNDDNLLAYVETELARWRALMMTAGKQDLARTPVTDTQLKAVVMYMTKLINIVLA